MSETGRRAKRSRIENRWISAYEAVLKQRIRVVSPKSDEDGPPEDPEVITVTNVDLDISNNTKNHHTDEFEITDRLVGDTREFLVIRRGQKFNLKIEFNREYNKEKDDLRFVFQFGQSPRPTRNTHAEFVLSERDVDDDWCAYIQSKEGNSISLVVMTPPACPVGKWRMHIDVVKRADNETDVFRYAHQDPIYILFNPWCEKDNVYLYEKGDKLLDEYVLNETGKIYSGSSERISPKPWEFGQFQGNVLDCVLYLLDESSLQDHARGDPVLVSRRLSALVNCSDDKGVLTGNWSGDYAGGISPLKWTGSGNILEQYYDTKQAVQFGQCWVFSGVLTTACRALGIPARSVTNFSSAHDTDGSVTIDTHFDKDGEPIEYENSDSVWNFHVWNDVWMARPDLPPGYGGWQAIDATPQETSDGVFCMGPMSLEAIKRGEVSLPYDGSFVFAEVNADRVYWSQIEGGGFQVSNIQESVVGKFISTKQPLKEDREDVTVQYKYPYGWAEERAAVKTANLKASPLREKYSDVYKKLPKDVTFEIITNPDTFMGDTIKVALKFTNTSAEKRQIDGTLLLSSMYYTGVKHKLIKQQYIDFFELKSNEEKLVNLEVQASEYLDKLTDHCMCTISSMCFVKETKQAASQVQELRLRKPHLDIKAPEKGTVGKTFEVEVSFKNPLDVTLTNCELRVEGPYLQKAITYKQKDVGANNIFTGKFEMTPSKAGKREMIVYFNCSQIDAVNSSYVITIDKK